MCESTDPQSSHLAVVQPHHTEKFQSGQLVRADRLCEGNDALIGYGTVPRKIQAHQLLDPALRDERGSDTCNVGLRRRL